LVERVVALRKVGALRSVPTDHLAHLASAARERTLEPEDVLFHEGDPPYALYVLLSGEVRVERGGRPAGNITAVCPVGAGSLLADRPRPARAVAATSCTLLELDRDAFREVLAEHPELSRCLITDLARRLQELLAEADGGSD
jgi:CRP-like cAMP-binding protein